MSSITSNIFFQEGFFFFFFYAFRLMPASSEARAPQSPDFAAFIFLAPLPFATFGILAPLWSASGRCFWAESGAPQVPQTSACKALSGTKADCTPQ